MSKFTNFTLNGRSLAVRYIETQQVKAGVECDSYVFNEDVTKDLAIVRVQAGYATPLQRVVQGTDTIEEFLEGKATLTVWPPEEDKLPQVFQFCSPKDIGREENVQVGQKMQWKADNKIGLIFYEICTPPYKDGRFENLADDGRE